MRNIRERIESFTEWPTSWTPQEAGEVLVGKILRFSEGVNPYGVCTTVTVELDQPMEIEHKEEGAKLVHQMTIWLSNTVLQDLFQRLNPRVGDVIGIKYLGKHPEKGYHRYYMEVDPGNPNDTEDAPATFLPACLPARQAEASAQADRSTSTKPTREEDAGEPSPGTAEFFWKKAHDLGLTHGDPTVAHLASIGSVTGDWANATMKLVTQVTSNRMRSGESAPGPFTPPKQGERQANQPIQPAPDWLAALRAEVSQRTLKDPRGANPASPQLIEKASKHVAAPLASAGVSYEPHLLMDYIRWALMIDRPLNVASMHVLAAWCKSDEFVDQMTEVLRSNPDHDDAPGPGESKSRWNEDEIPF